MTFPPPTAAQVAYQAEWGKACAAYEQAIAPARTRYAKAFADAKASGTKILPAELTAWNSAAWKAGQAFRAIWEPAAATVDAALAAAKETTQ